MYPTFRASPHIRLCSALLAAALVLGCDDRRTNAVPPAASAPPRVLSPTSAPAAKTPPAPAPAVAADAEAFWIEYREAALSGDTARLLPLVNFPFTTRGSMDWDPVVKHGRTKFPALFARLLDQEILGRDFSMTERDLLFDTPRLPPEEVESSKDGWFRVGDFEFKRINGAWKLIHAFTDEP